MSTFPPAMATIAPLPILPAESSETIADSRQIKAEDLEELQPFADFESHESYPFSLQMNARGEKIPVYPYVISILGDLELEQGDRDEVIVRRALRKYLEQVINLWERRAGKEAPLIIMLSLLGSSGRIITEEALEIQRKHLCVHLMAVLPMERNLLSQREKEDVNRFRPQFEPTEEEREADPLCEQRYIWALTEKDLSCEESSKITNLHSKNFNKKFKASKQRRFHEMLAIHSHLMIVLWSNWKHSEKEVQSPNEEPIITEHQACAREESFVPDEKTIEWVVRMKLEGYYGELLHEHTDTLTYTAIGPVLYIDTSKKSLEDKEGPSVYYLADGTEITKEKRGRRVMTAENLKKIPPCRWLWLFEQGLLPDSWLWWFEPGIVRENDIRKNITLVGELNRKIIEETEPNRKPLQEFVRERYLRNLRQTEALTYNAETHKVDIHQPEISTQQFMNHYQVVDKMADSYREKTDADIRLYIATFCCVLLGAPLFAFFARISLLAYGSLVNFPFKLIEALFSEGHWFPIFCAVGLILSFLSLCTGFILSWYCFWRSRKHNHLYYHCFQILAESIQVQIFWRMGGVDSMVSGHFRSHQIDSLKWLRIALNGLDVTIPSALPPVNFHKQVRFVDKIWVESTETYIKEQLALAKYRNPLNFLCESFCKMLEKKLFYSSEWWGYIIKMFFVALAFTFLCTRPIFVTYSTNKTCEIVSEELSSVSGFMASHASWTNPVYSNTLILILQLLTVIWIICYAYDKMNLNEKNDDKHKAMLPTFVMADYLLDFISDDNSSQKGNTTSSELTKEHQKQCKDILEELGQEVLAKTADWFLASADREMTKPKLN